MKTKKLFFIALVALFASCTTEKVALKDNQLGVASSVPGIQQQASTQALQPVTLPANETATQMSESAVLPASTVETEGMLAMAPQANEMNQKEMALKVANDLRTISADADSRFASRILNRTANRIETADFSQNKKLTFFEKIKKKIASKFVERYAEKYAAKSGMDTPDILAIVALGSGALAWVAYYGSFLFGLAGIALGIVALKKGTSRRGMAIAGIALGAAAIVFWILLIAVVFSVW